MNPLDLPRVVLATFSPAAREHLAGRIGLSQEHIERVIELSAAAMSAALLAQCAMPQGASAVFAELLSPDANARIAEQLDDRLFDMASLKDLEASGDRLFQRNLQRRVAVLCEPLADQTGVPLQATHVLAALSSAVLCGLIKHHLLVEQAGIDALVPLLRDQWPAIAPHISDGLARAIGWESAASLLVAMNRSATTVLPTQLERPQSVMHSSPVPQPVILPGRHQATSIAAPPGPPIVPSVAPPNFAPRMPSMPASPIPIGPSGAIASGGDNGAPTRQRAPSRGRWRVGAVLAALVVVLVAALVYDDTHTGLMRQSIATWAGAARRGPPAIEGRVRPARPPAVPPAAPPAAASAAATALTAAADFKPAGMLASPAACRADASATLVYRTDESGTAHMVAVVASETERQTLLGTLRRQFGAEHIQADVSVNPTAQADWLAHLDPLMGLLLVRGAELVVQDTCIVLAGSAADTARQAWPARLASIFGHDRRIVTFDPEAQIEQASQAFQHAVSTFSAAHLSPCASSDMVRVLNAQRISFAHGSGHVPASARSNLDLSAALLKSCANADRPVSLEIAAYTDNRGSALDLLKLSQKRADAVRAQLVAQGVPGPSLMAKGYGPADPVASNLTRIGRFANRRVAFVVPQDRT